jgi:hypothetical protein
MPLTAFQGRLYSTGLIRSKHSWRCYINTVTDYLNIIHCPDFTQNDVSETGICFRPNVRSLLNRR